MSGAAPSDGRAGQVQLALRFPLSSRCRFDDFVVGDNAELLRRLEELPVLPGGMRGCFLFGPAGSGRTHLLQAACHRHGPRGGAIYLPLADAAVAPELFDGLGALALVALDDVHLWLGDGHREATLMALYQSLLEAGGCLLVSAAVAPAELGFCLPDLASRLRALPGYRVREPDDAGKARVLERLARERGLELTGPVLDFWLARSTRRLADLLQQFERLDAAAMAAQRRVTVPLLKEVLGL
jgi:DnaA-homolog protein